MLEHLRLRVIEFLTQVQAATLVTSGPAGIQAHIFPCEAHDLIFYLLVSSTSDQLLNLEHDPAVVVSTSGWQLRGIGSILPLNEAPNDLLLPQSPQASGCVLVAIRPFRLQITRPDAWGFSETLDLD